MMNENERKECISIIVHGNFFCIYHSIQLLALRYTKKIVNAISLSSDDNNDAINVNFYFIDAPTDVTFKTLHYSYTS